MGPMDVDWTNSRSMQGTYQLSLHAMERASLRGVDPLEAKEALLNGEIIEDYPKDRRGHGCLVYGKSHHLIRALSEAITP